MAQQKDPTPPKLGITQVDLGSDLIETETAASGILKRRKPRLGDTEIKRIEEENASELLKNAKILISENFLEDAKKVLHKVVLKDPGDIVARQLLNEVYQLELKQILGDLGGEEKIPRKRYGPRSTVEHFDPIVVIRDLDHDLELQLFEEDGSLRPETPGALFQDKQKMEAFYSRLEADLSDGTIQDWIDLGIAFIEMEMFAIAIHVLQTANERINRFGIEDKTVLISVTSLLALAFLAARQPLDALVQVQQVVADDDIPKEDKIELFYLMGRSYEAMEKPEVAVQFYRQVEQLDGQYRDIGKRLPAK